MLLLVRGEVPTEGSKTDRAKRDAMVVDLILPGMDGEVVKRSVPIILQPRNDAPELRTDFEHLEGPIGDLLLDQSVIAGVGKVHVADDAAFAHALAENVAGRIVLQHMQMAERDSRRLVHPDSVAVGAAMGKAVGHRADDSGDSFGPPPR